MTKADKNKMYSDVSYLTGIRPYRNSKNLKSLEIISNHIQSEFNKAGLETENQEWIADGNTYRNIIASYNQQKAKRLIIGAHYDVAYDTPGADDNASGVAGLLEVARLVAKNKPEIDYRIDFVAYCLEEPPYFSEPEMGSYIHAKSMNDNNVEVLGMICFEMIGYFSDLPGSQPNPVPELALDIPNVGDFIAVVGLEEHRVFNERIYELMLENEAIDTYVINFPANNGYTGMSDQRNYFTFGYKAVMITDTATERNRHNYHQLTDTIDTLNFEKMSEVVNSTYNAVVKL